MPPPSCRKQPGPRATPSASTLNGCARASSVDHTVVVVAQRDRVMPSIGAIDAQPQVPTAVRRWPLRFARSSPTRRISPRVDRRSGPGRADRHWVIRCRRGGRADRPSPAAAARGQRGRCCELGRFTRAGPLVLSDRAVFGLDQLEIGHRTPARAVIRHLGWRRRAATDRGIDDVWRYALSESPKTSRAG